MTAGELYTSLKSLYTNMMFPKSPYARQWTLAEIDQLDVHFFNELMEFEPDEQPQQEEDVYLSDIW